MLDNIKSGVGTTRELAMPRGIYQSPLQRSEETLRIPQAGLDSSSIALASSPQLPSSSISPVREVSNFSYRLLPGGNAFPACDSMANHAFLGSGQNGSATSPSSIRSKHAPQNKGYFKGTSLLSSLFSNPRTRAPFKPQKSNRGTSSWQLKQYAEATLGSGSLRKAVRLPEGEDKDEWLAVNGRTYYRDVRTDADTRR